MVDFAQELDIFLAEASAFQDLHYLLVERMRPLTLISKLAVSLEKVLADMEVGARGCELTDTMLTIAPVVV